MAHKIREVHIELENGIRVIAEVDSVNDIKGLFDELAKAKLLATQNTGIGVKATEQREKPDVRAEASPEARMETRANLAPGTLKKAKIIGFKDDIPQLMRPAALPSVSDASLVLIFAIESGLGQNSVEFEAFKGLYEAQNIKSGSSLSMLLNNLKNSGYIDSKLYNTERKVRLAAKGETKAVEVLKSMLTKGS